MTRTEEFLKMELRNASYTLTGSGCDPCKRRYASFTHVIGGQKRIESSSKIVKRIRPQS
jgi:hypothetical protein